ncbi:unnamed protein product [Rotaria socialis]
MKNIELTDTNQQSEHTDLLLAPTRLPTTADEHYYWNALSTASTIARQPSPSSGPQCDQAGLLLTPTSLLTTTHEYGSNSSSTPQTAVQQSDA